MTDISFESLAPEYADLWQRMSVRDTKKAAVDVGVKKMLEQRASYEAVEAAIGVPWYVVGLIHKMESNCHPGRHLHNGDPLTAKTVRVPAGRPRKGAAPFRWHESAIDALTMKGYHKIDDWTIERICWCLERYNGWGYRKYHAGVLSPYLWSYSSHYRSGKYVSDGKWSPSAVSGQAGAMPLLAGLIEVVPDIAPQLAHDAPLIEAPEPEPADEFTKAEPPAVKDAARESKTIMGGLIALLGTIASYFNDAVEGLLKFSGDALSAMTELTSVKSLASALGANVNAIGAGLALAGISIVIVRRLDAARKGKIG